MKQTGLSQVEIDLLCSTFLNYPAIEQVILFGSRAKGTAKPNSDIDLAVVGISDVLTIEKFAVELDELPLPYKFDVKPLDGIKNLALLEHIRRVGVVVYEKKQHHG